MKKHLVNTIDFIYNLLPVPGMIRKVMKLQTFRYAFVGMLNLFYGVVQYWFIYNYLLFQQDVDLYVVTISAPVFALLLNFVITFFTGFFLVREIAFDESKVRSRTQLFRYAMVVALNLCINYGGIKLFVEVLAIYPSVSNALIQVITVNVSFLINKHFTFKA